MTSSVHEPVTSVGGWPPPGLVARPRAVGRPHRCTGGDGTAPPRPPAPPFSPPGQHASSGRWLVPRAGGGVAGTQSPLSPASRDTPSLPSPSSAPLRARGSGLCPLSGTSAKNRHPFPPPSCSACPLHLVAGAGRGWEGCPPPLHPHPSIPIPPALGWQR